MVVKDAVILLWGVETLSVDLNFVLVVQEPDDLFETISQAMLNAVDRDAVSGMGVVVHVM